MTIYVYKLRGQAPFGIRAARSLPWYGLTADTEDELHPFAFELGLYRHFYHPVPSSGDGRTPAVGHYDLDQGEHERAVAAGAQVITWRTRAKMMKTAADGPGNRGT